MLIYDAPNIWQRMDVATHYRDIQHMSNEQKWTSDDDIKFVSIGEGEDKKGNPRVKQFSGKYLFSETRRIKKRLTTLHVFEVGDDEVRVFGSGSINHKISRIPGGTYLRLTYKGEKDIGADSPMKDIKVEWPRGTVLKNAPEVDSADDVEF